MCSAAISGGCAAYLLAIHLVKFTGPGDQMIYVNPAEVVSVRPPRAGFDNDINCLLHTADGKFISVIESCHDVLLKLERAMNEED